MNVYLIEAWPSILLIELRVLDLDAVGGVCHRAYRGRLLEGKHATSARGARTRVSDAFRTCARRPSMLAIAHLFDEERLFAPI